MIEIIYFFNAQHSTVLSNDHRHGAIADSKLVVDVVQMVLNRGDTDDKLISDLSIRSSDGQGVKNLAFPRRQVY